MIEQEKTTIESAAFIQCTAIMTLALSSFYSSKKVNQKLTTVSQFRKNSVIDGMFVILTVTKMSGARQMTLRSALSILSQSK